MNELAPASYRKLKMGKLKFSCQIENWENIYVANDMNLITF